MKDISKNEEVKKIRLLTIFQSTVIEHWIVLLVEEYVKGQKITVMARTVSNIACVADRSPLQK